MKKRKQKMEEYDRKFSNIPKDYNDRLVWLYDELHLNSFKCDSIISKYYSMMNTLEFKRFFIVLYEIPEGSPRPRFRLVNRKNLSNHFSDSIDSLIKVLELSNDFIDDTEFNAMIDSIKFCIKSVDEINSQMNTIINLFDTIPPLTKKFNKSKRNFTSNIKALSKELKNIKGMLYNLLAELD